MMVKTHIQWGRYESPCVRRRKKKKTWQHTRTHTHKHTAVARTPTYRKVEALSSSSELSTVSAKALPLLLENAPLAPLKSSRREAIPPPPPLPLIRPCPSSSSPLIPPPHASPPDLAAAAAGTLMVAIAEVPVSMDAYCPALSWAFEAQYRQATQAPPTPTSTRTTTPTTPALDRPLPWVVGVGVEGVEAVALGMGR